MFKRFVLGQKHVFLFIICKETFFIFWYRNTWFAVLIWTRPTWNNYLPYVIYVFFIGILINKWASLSQTFTFGNLLLPDLVTKLIMQVFHHYQQRINWFQILSNDALRLKFLDFFVWLYHQSFEFCLLKIIWTDFQVFTHAQD